VCTRGFFRVGTSIAPLPRVINFFMVGTARVTWELVSVDKTGTCRLSIAHAGGVIVEYFTDTAAALRRESEIEALMTGNSSDSSGICQIR
jgi:hypothetical protein